jgi:hypothetical protein
MDPRKSGFVIEVLCTIYHYLLTVEEDELNGDLREKAIELKDVVEHTLILLESEEFEPFEGDLKLSK